MEKPEQEDLTRCRKAVEDLSEFFDSVQIFATRHDGKDIGTVNVNFGCGNWFARKGQVSEWLLKEEESTREYIRSEIKTDNS